MDDCASIGGRAERCGCRYAQPRESPWNSSNSYADMADDLAEVIGSLGGPMDVDRAFNGGKGPDGTPR